MRFETRSSSTMTTKRSTWNKLVTMLLGLTLSGGAQVTRAAEQRVESFPGGNVNNMYLITADGHQVPAIVGYTSDGNGNIIPIGGGGGGSTTVIQGTIPWVVSGSVTVSGSTGRTWNLSQSTDSISSWLFDGVGNPILSTSGSLNVSVTNTIPISGTVTANQGTTPWVTSVSNFPATQPVSGTVTVIQPVGTNLNADVDVTSSVLPTGAATSAKQPSLGTPGTASTDVITVQGISGMTSLLTNSLAQGVNATVIPSESILVGGNNGSSILTPILTDDSGALMINSIAVPVTVVQSSGASLNANVSVTSALPAGSNTIGAVTQSGTWSVNQSGTWTTGRTWNLSSGADSVSALVSNFPATQAINLTQILGSSPGVTNYVPARITNGTSYIDPTQIRALTSADVVTVVQPTGANLNTNTAITSSLPAGSATIGAVTQASGPWTQNITQFGGTNISTGLGPSGAGIPRVTLSTDSSVSVSGTVNVGTVSNPVTVIQPTGSNLNTNTAITSALPSGTNSIGGVTQSGTWTTGRTWTLSNSTDSVAAVQSGTWNIGTLSTITNPVTVVQSVGSNLNTNTAITSALPAGSNTIGGVTQSGSWTVTANAGTNLNTSALALDTSVNGILRAQGSTTSGQSGPLIQGAVTTAAPSYTTAQTSPLSLTTSGLLRVDASGTTVTVTANQGTSPWVSNISQFGGSNVVTGTGASGAGIPRVTVSNDSNVLATQSGTWTVQPGNTSNTSPWLVTVATALPAGSNVIGAVTQSGGPWTSNVTQFGSNNVITGTGTSGVGIPRVTVSNDSNVLATQSGTWTVQQGTPPWSVVGNVASAASDSGNPVKVGGIFHSATQTFSDGNRSDLQLNSHGIVFSDVTSTDVTGTFTSTGTTSAIDGSGYGTISFTADVSAASGTTPTLDIELQESQDGSADWASSMGVNRFTATGSQFVPALKLSARYYRFQYTIGGSTPSFTFTVKTTLKTQSATIRKEFYKFNDLVMTTANNFSTTVNLAGCSFWDAMLVRGAGGAGVAIAAQFSNDGTNWVTSGTSTNTSASTNYLINNATGNAVNLTQMAKFARFTNTNNQAAATTLDIKWYCKE